MNSLKQLSNAVIWSLWSLRFYEMLDIPSI